MLHSRFSLALLFLLAPCACLAQTGSAPPTPTAQDQNSTAKPAGSPAKNPVHKKVWTNENLSDANGKVSVVGDNRNQKYSPTPAKAADSATVSKIRENLQKLQAQLDTVNQQLAAFKEFQEGEPVS